MKHVIAIIAIMLSASCAEGPTTEPPVPKPPSKTVVDGNWEVARLQFYICNEYNCEVIGYPRAVYECMVKPAGFLSFTPMPGEYGKGTLVAEIFWTSSCKEVNEQDRLLTLATYTVYVDNGSLLMDIHGLDYGSLDYVAAIHSAGEGKVQLDFFYDGAYVFGILTSYAGDALDCVLPQSPETDDPYGYCYMDWHCGVLLTSCIAKDDCTYVLDSYGRSHGSWNLGDENECLELRIPDKPWMD